LASGLQADDVTDATAPADGIDAGPMRVRRELARRDLKAALLLEADNVRLATGYQSSSDASLQYPECWALAFADGPTVVWDHPDSEGRDELPSADAERRFASGWDWLGPPSRDAAPFVAAVAAALAERHLPRGPIAVDAASPSVFAGLFAAGIEVHDAGELLQEARLIWSRSEIDRLRAACVTCEAALAEAAATITPGTSVGAVWRSFAGAAVRAGAEACAPPADLDRQIRAGSLVPVEGWIVGEGGFPAHLARTFGCGAVDVAEVERAHRSLALQIESCRPGTTLVSLRAPGVDIHGCAMVGDGSPVPTFPVITADAAPAGALREGMVLSVGVRGSGTPQTGPIHVRDQIVITDSGPLTLTKR
jgi:Xaa-Pro aminopeptidase